MNWKGLLVNRKVLGIYDEVYLLLPTQFLPSGVRLYPSRHKHLKEPMLLMHWPFLHTWLEWTLHSSTSVNHTNLSQLWYLRSHDLHSSMLNPPLLLESKMNDDQYCATSCSLTSKKISNMTLSSPFTFTFFGSYTAFSIISHILKSYILDLAS